MTNLVTEIISHPPIKLVIVSTLCLAFYLYLILFIEKIVKLKIPYFIILLGFSILPLLSILRLGSYESGDLNTHVINSMEFYKSLQSGILVPRWSENLNATYGYPVFMFIYPLPYYISSFFHLFGFGFITSVKLLLASTYIVSGLGMYLFLRRYISEKYAFLGAIFYLYAPYHLVDLHFRNAIGEMTGLAILPISLMLLERTANKRKILNVILSAFSISLLILSHPAISILSFPILVVYSIYINKKAVKDLVIAVVPHILGLLLSLYYWLPVLVEGSFTQQANQVKSALVYPTLRELFISNWRFGLLFQGQYGELSSALGYGHWITICIALYLIIKRKIISPTYYFFLGVFLIFFIMIQGISAPIWQIFEILRRMQFPYRLLTILILSSSIVAAFTMSKIKNEFIFKLVVIIAIGTTILNWGNRRNTPNITDRVLSDDIPYSTSQFAGISSAVPIWAPNYFWQTEVPKEHIEAIEGNIKIISENRSINTHIYKITVIQNSLIKENTSYFPGWNLTINNNTGNIDYRNPNYPGIITFPLNTGVYDIVLKFSDTPVRSYSLILSATTLMLMGMILVLEVLSIKFIKSINTQQ